EGGQDVVEGVGELGQAHGDGVGALPGQHDVVRSGLVRRQQLPADGVDQRLDGRDERLLPRAAHASSSPITLTWSETRVAPAARVRRSRASTAPSTSSAPPSTVLPNGPTSTASSCAASTCRGASSRSKGSVVNSTLNRTRST